MHIDLAFSINSDVTLPSDHGYCLFGAVSRVIPMVHEKNELGIHPIRGKQIGNRRMQLSPHSRLTFRIPSEKIHELLPLTGSSISIGGAELAIGVPQIHPLKPTSSIYSRLVVIKLSNTAPGRISTDDFVAATWNQLRAHNVSEGITVVPGKRRTLRIKELEIVGYEMLLEGLSPDESIAIQMNGLGGRRHMGCGVFSPRR